MQDGGFMVGLDSRAFRFDARESVNRAEVGEFVARPHGACAAISQGGKMKCYERIRRTE
jgi:hypothetical protein